MAAELLNRTTVSYRIFKLPQSPENEHERALAAPPDRIICGLLMVEVDPQIDPGIQLPARADRDYKIRRITPRTCTR